MSSPPPPIQTKPGGSTRRPFLAFAGQQNVVGDFKLVALGSGRCDRRDKSGGPPLLKLSLKVKRKSAHSQSSMFVVVPPHGRNAPGRLMVCLRYTSGLLGLKQGHRGRSMPSPKPALATRNT